VRGSVRVWKRLGVVQRRAYHYVFNMRVKQTYIRIENIRRIDVDENGRAAVFTKDGEEILCKSWQIVVIGGHPFLLLEEPWMPVWMTDVEELNITKRPKD